MPGLAELWQTLNTPGVVGFKTSLPTRTKQSAMEKFSLWVFSLIFFSFGHYLHNYSHPPPLGSGFLLAFVANFISMGFFLSNIGLLHLLGILCITKCQFCLFEPAICQSPLSVSSVHEHCLETFSEPTFGVYSHHWKSCYSYFVVHSFHKHLLCTYCVQELC